jgi:hypothetical protein
MTELIVKLLRIDGGQVVGIPSEFDFRSKWVTVRQRGLIEPTSPPDAGEKA